MSAKLRESIMCPLQRCYPASKTRELKSVWNSGRWLTAKQTAELAVRDQAGRDRLIARLVARMRVGRRG